MAARVIVLAAVLMPNVLMAVHLAALVLAALVLAAMLTTLLAAALVASLLTTLLTTLLAPLLAPLALLSGRLIHQIQDAEIMLGVLEIAFRHDPVAAAGRVAAKLQIFLKQLLRGATDTQIGSIAVEDMVTVERNAASRMEANRSAAPATTPAAPAA